MKRFWVILLLLASQSLFSQSRLTHQRIFKIGVFAPLYLDSVFENYQFKFDKAIPKFIMPGVEFVQGAQIAFDSMTLYNDRVDAYIYDTRSYLQPIPWLIKYNIIDSLDLIIGSVKDVDYKELSDFAEKRKIPFISVTYPNDGGVTGNPYLAIMNSTLKAHCEGIYSYILQNHGTDKVYLVRKPGQQEDKIAAYFKMINEQEGKPLLNIQTISFDSTISPSFFRYRLDSTHNSVIIGGSFDEGFAKQLTDACFAVAKKNYPVTLIGMPDWESFKEFSQANAYKDFPIRFTSPYNNSKTGPYNALLTSEYNKRYKAKPTDLAYKGFEAAWLLTNLLVKFPDDLMSHLSDRSITIFNEFNFRPVYPKKNSNTPDYFENKHLYVMRILNGVVSREW